MKKYASCDEYFATAAHWRNEIAVLRQIVLSTGLTECLKWSLPCYTASSKNVVGIGAFKSYFGLWFFEGSSLEDSRGVLTNAQQGKTKAMRQWRMTSGDEIKPRIIKSYIKDAAELAKAGVITKPDRNRPINVPDELQTALAQDSRLSQAFEELKPGLKREMCDHISQAKRPETRLRRLAKLTPYILEGISPHDRYRK
ncbi:MAG TPA: hypothetical protein DDW52_01860 [Planctomycetaceae bacterium]|nr:hypothetical protein [Planctomycetaceae bacterium]